MNRSVNEGFSGGEKKRNEIFQMAVLDPRLAILDETDSGLDIDALRIVADGVNALRSRTGPSSVVTHYQRLLNYIVPDYVHVLSDGRIVNSGDKGLALELEEKGYAWIAEQLVGSDVWTPKNEAQVTIEATEEKETYVKQFAAGGKVGRRPAALVAPDPQGGNVPVRENLVSPRLTTRSGGSRACPRSRRFPSTLWPTTSWMESRLRRSSSSPSVDSTA